MKKIISLVLSLVLIALAAVPAFAATMSDGIDALNAEFIYGEGPKTNGLAIDYRYFTPVSENDTTKYPLVIWLHGMGNGFKEGQQITNETHIGYWVSDEFQARFTNGGAFILAPRSNELKGICWNSGTIEPLKAAIDDFIATNKDNIDISRIYIGGYSMGGKMTLKMAIAYPEMFAAAFPICPAWSPDAEAFEYVADMPMWITSGKTDPLVNYDLSVTKTFEKLAAASNVASECRLSILEKVCFEDGTKCSSGHHAWYSVNHDMFSSENGDYPYMTTINGLGETVVLTYPDGMISWLCAHTSDYDGAPSEGKGNAGELDNTDSIISLSNIFEFFRSLIETIKNLLKF